MDRKKHPPKAAGRPAAKQQPPQPARRPRTKEEALQELARQDPRRAAALLREILEKNRE